MTPEELATKRNDEIYAYVDNFRWAMSQKPELIWRDNATGIRLHVQSDGRSMTARNRYGWKLWSFDPMKESGIAPYRIAFPQVTYLGDSDRLSDRCERYWGKGAKCVYLGYSSTQGGTLNLRTGQLELGDQD